MNKRDIINDIRSVFPGAGLLNKEQVGRYLNKGRESTSSFLRDVPKVNTGNKAEYLVIDIASKLYEGRVDPA